MWNPTSDLGEQFAIDALHDVGREKPCQTCRWVSYDMDGNYCGHRKSIDASMGFGQSIGLARSPGPPRDMGRTVAGVCGPDGALWEEKK